MGNLFVLLGGILAFSVFLSCMIAQFLFFKPFVIGPGKYLIGVSAGFLYYLAVTLVSVSVLGGFDKVDCVQLSILLGFLLFTAFFNYIFWTLKIIDYQKIYDFRFEKMKENLARGCIRPGFLCFAF